MHFQNLFHHQVGDSSNCGIFTYVMWELNMLTPEPHTAEYWATEVFTIQSLLIFLTLHRGELWRWQIQKYKPKVPLPSSSWGQLQDDSSRRSWVYTSSIQYWILEKKINFCQIKEWNVRVWMVVFMWPLWLATCLSCIYPLTQSVLEKQVKQMYVFWNSMWSCYIKILLL